MSGSTNPALSNSSFNVFAVRPRFIVGAHVILEKIYEQIENVIFHLRLSCSDSGVAAPGGSLNVAFELEDQHHRGHGFWFESGTNDQVSRSAGSKPSASNKIL